VIKNRLPTFPLIFLLTTTFALLTATFARGQTQIVASVFAAKQPGAPLQVIGLRKSGRPDSYRVLVQNAGEIPIAAFVVDATISAPCLPNSPFDRMGRRWDTTYVPPHAVVTAREFIDRDSVWVIHGAQHMRSNFVHVQIGVTEVRFADGTSWRSELANVHFTPSLLSVDSKRCGSWPNSSGVEDVRSVKYVKQGKQFLGVNRTAQPDGATGYLLACVVKADLALCPAD
jgi:hypothetical protein